MTKPKLNIWITGASSGIGLALTQLLGQQGHRVFISARDKEKLNEIAHGHNNIIPIAFDVSCEQAIPEVRERLQQYTSTLDQLFVNAGTCEYLDVSAPDWSMVRRITDVNLFGAVNTVAAALPLLQNQAQEASRLEGSTRKPQIIGISSMATVIPFSKAQAYGASKAGLNYFLGALGLDLRGLGIHVTTVMPGFVQTPLTDKNTFSMPFIITADQAAWRIVSGIDKYPRTLVFPKRLYWILRLSACFPALWEKFMSPKVNGTRKLGEAK